MGDFLRHLFIPHHTNNHRARVLHVDAMFVYLFAFIIFRMTLHAVHVQFPDVLGFATDIHVEQLLQATNAKRVEAGLMPLSLDDRLSQAAAGKARDMFSDNYWAHNNPSGKTPWVFIVDAGYKYRIAGENLAKNFSTSNAVVDAWMASPTHRDNVMRADYKDIGFAVVNGELEGEETTLVVQMFGAGDSQLAYQTKPVVTSKTAAVSEIPAPSGESRFASTAARYNAPLSLTGALGLTDVLVKPLVDISSLSKKVTMTFVGLFLVLIGVDAWIVYRKKIVRVSGHSVGHMMFFVMMILLLQIATRGAIL